MALCDPFLLALRNVPFWPVLLIAPVILYLLVHGKTRMGKEKTIRLPPSPPWLPIIGHLHLMVKEPHRTLQRLAHSMGPVIYLQLGGVPAVVVSSPEAAKAVMKTLDVHCCNRPSSPGAKMLTYNYRDIAFSPYSERWRERRKLFISELVGSKRVQSFSHALEEQVDQLIQSLSSDPQWREPINFNEMIYALIDGFIGTVAFGRMNGAKLLKYNEFQQVFSEALVVLSAFSAQDFFPASLISRWLDKLVGLEARYQRIFCELDTYFETVISQHMNPGRVQSDKDNLVDVLIGLWKGQGKGLSVTKDDLKAIIMDAFIGGTSTSSVTLLWAMSELVKNPRVMNKVQSEIRSSVNGKRVQVSDTSQLKYLRMVIKETFRLHPPAPFLVPRETMQQVQLLGYDLPPKTRIFVNVWAIGRDPACWKNPEEFYPERFEGVDIDFQGLNFQLLPFGSGRRSCPAIPMGIMNVEFILASLLYSFDWKLPQGMAIEDVSMEGTGRQLFTRSTPLYLVPSLYK